jgi:hypothetical protein
MVCIASFIILAILSIFSRKYRPLLKKGWYCASRRVTFRPCDTTFRDEIKTTLLAPLAIKRPRAVRPASIAIEIGAWTMVVSMIITAYIVLHGGLNLIAFGTCNRQNPEGCVVDAQGCGIPDVNPNFWESLTSGDVVGAVRNEGAAWVDTFQALPLRFRGWNAANYVPEVASWRDGFTEGLPITLEVIDPGCQFCAVLSENISEARLTGTHNVTYIVYPIMGEDGPVFANSVLVAEYLTAIKIFEQGTPRADDPADWFILDRLFADEGNIGLAPEQIWLNEHATADEVVERIHEWLTEHGYSAEDIAAVDALASSQQVADLLQAGRHNVENQIRTVWIPTFIGGGAIHRGAVSVEVLENLGDGGGITAWQIGGLIFLVVVVGGAGTLVTRRVLRSRAAKGDSGKSDGSADAASCDLPDEADDAVDPDAAPGI